MKVWAIPAHTCHLSGDHRTRIATLTTTLGFALLASAAQAQSMYGEVGYTGLDDKASGFKASPGLAVGAGATHHLSKTTYLNLDYTCYQDKDSKTLGGVSAGVGFRF